MPSVRAPELHLSVPMKYEYVIRWDRFHDEDMLTSGEQIIIQATVNMSF
jgi:hypothetical protein